MSWPVARSVARQPDSRPRPGWSAATPAPRRAPTERTGTALRGLLCVVAVVVAASVLAGWPSGAGGGPGTAGGGVPVPGPAAAPVRLTVPSIGVTTPLVRLGVDAAGALEPPDDFAVAGWFAAGPVPGATGPAVLAGHVDSSRGPAVFSRLEEVAVGDEVSVDRADGTAVRFAVTRVERHPKDAFPTVEVYGPTPGAELRLITCGGAFDRTQRSYTDNVVVFARPAG